MYSSEVSHEELESLKAYRGTTDRFSSDLSFSSGELLDLEARKRIIAAAAARMGAPNKMAASSILMKRLGFIPVLGLYAFYKWGKVLDLSIENVMVETDDRESGWLPRFRLKTWRFVEWKGKGRAEMRQKNAERIFTGFLSPIMASLSQETSLSKHIMWENIAVYIFWLYESLLNSESDPALAGTLREDMEFICREAEGRIFGPCRSNPLTRYFHEKTGGIRYRSTCCLAYMLGGTGGKRCKTCPHYKCL
ncbi:IucA/IucC family C-terminal-domain containing protein [Peribacillus sp. SCS-26]|uniref:IucA/IucC family C-terminal-domain containing protein n=1 Tax=Paraperibacillus marinus TaxID=3115295 RepID=UPI00390576CA